MQGCHGNLHSLFYLSFQALNYSRMAAVPNTERNNEQLAKIWCLVNIWYFDQFIFRKVRSDWNRVSKIQWHNINFHLILPNMLSTQYRSHHLVVLSFKKNITQITLFQNVKPFTMYPLTALIMTPSKKQKHTKQNIY